MSHEHPLTEWPDTPLWSENYAAMFVAPNEQVAIFTSMGRWYGDPTVWREVIGIGLPGGRVIFSKNYGRNVGPTGPAAALGRWETITPERRLCLRFDGPMRESSLESLAAEGWREGPMRRCVIDLEFEALHPLWSMKGTSHEAQTVAGGMHTEQIGAVNGTVAYDRTYEFKDGYAIRDHSRGVRDPKDFYRYCWMSGHFPGSGRGFYVYLMQSRGTEGDGMANATVSDGKTLYPAEVTERPFLSTVEDGQKLPTVVVTSELGEMRVVGTRLVGRVLNAFWNPFDTSIGFATHISAASIFADGLELDCDGEQGIGWCERGLAPEPL